MSDQMPNVLRNFKTGVSTGSGKLWAFFKKKRLDHAAKQPACLTECGKVMPWWQNALKLLIGGVFELVTVALGIVFIWFNALFFFLQAESVDLDVLRPNVQGWFSERFDGRSAEIDQVRVNWHEDKNSLALEVKGTTIRNKAGEIISTVDYTDLWFDLESLAYFKPAVTHVDIRGGEVTLHRKADGTVEAALGRPDMSGTMQASMEPSMEGTELPQTMSPRWRKLDSVTVSGSQLYILDDISGLNWSMENALLSYEKALSEDIEVEERLVATLSADLRSADQLTPLNANIKSDLDFTDLSIELTTAEFFPAKLLPDDPRLAIFRSVDAPISLNISLAATQDDGLTQADIEMNAGQGQWKIGDDRFAFNRASYVAEYDVQQEALVVKDINLNSELISLTGQARLSNIGDPVSGFLREPVGFDFNFRDFELDLKDNLPQPVKTQSIKLNGNYDLQSRRLNLPTIQADTGDFKTDLASEIVFRENAQGLDLFVLDGNLSGDITPQIILGFWPEDFAHGARRWIDRSLPAAKVPNIDTSIRLTGEHFDGAIVQNEDLSVAFNFEDGEVLYNPTMTPMRNVQGNAVLLGNRFDLEIDFATLGPELIVSNAVVEIPRLNPKGGDFSFTLDGNGPVSALLELVSDPPFEVAKKGRFDPQDFSGTGKIQFTMKRPLLENFDPELQIISITGQFVNVGTPFKIGEWPVEKGAISMLLNNDGLSLKGPINVGPWSTQLDFFDHFDEGLLPTQINVAGPMSRDELDRLGIGMRAYLDGDLFVEINALGTPEGVRTAKANIDLTPASLTLGDIWSKPEGKNGRLTTDLAWSDDAITLSDIKMNSDGLSVSGEAELQRDFKIKSLSLPELSIDRVIDGRLAMVNTAGAPISLAVDAEYMDVSPWIRDILNRAEEGEPVPLKLEGRAKRLVLSQALDLSDFDMTYNVSSRGLESTEMTAQLDDQIAVFNIAPDGEKARLLTAKLPQAQYWLSDLYDIRNIKGGTLDITAAMSAPGDPFALDGEAKLTDFSLVDVPAFAQILSLASLQGLADAMSGQGMRLAEFTAPFTYSEQILTVQEARMGGSSIGLTSNGMIDFADREMNLQGVLVPSYTINSMLGDIPLLGDIVVGKKGEGIFALNYTAKGSFDETQIAVNPLSAFTPGFLRRIFDPVPPEAASQLIDQLEEPAATEAPEQSPQ